MLRAQTLVQTLAPILAPILAFAAWAAPLAAHEFWIDAVEWEVPVEGTVQADLRIGEDFKGSAHAYLPPNFRRFELFQGGLITEVEGRAGDRPALNMPAFGEGLMTVVHVTKDNTLSYTDWQKFVNFATHKDFTWALDEHVARGLPQDKFRELYSRYAKSLIAVGDPVGQDIRAGLKVEIVAEANPYLDDISDGFPVRVYYEDRALPDVQVELFEKAPDGAVTVTLHRTDSSGLAMLPVREGHVYLADHVVLRAMEPEADGDPVWESLWASLTFKISD